jgi:hypothetical protein
MDVNSGLNTEVLKKIVMFSNKLSL